MIYKIKGKSPRIHENCGFIADSARIIGDAEVAEGANVWFNAVIRGDMDHIFVGKNSNVQDCVVIHTDAGFPVKVGEGVTIGHGAVVHGCTVKDHCLIGMNAVVLNGAIIGEESLVGAGSLVPQGMIVPPRSLVAGSPAKVIKSLKPGMIQGIKENCLSYVRESEAYKAGLEVLG